MIKVGDSNLTFIENLTGKMPAFQAGDVSLEITFSEDDIHHYVLIRDRNSGQQAYINVPSSFSN